MDPESGLIGKLRRKAGLKYKGNPCVLRLGDSGGHRAQEGSVWVGQEPLETALERLAGH